VHKAVTSTKTFVHCPNCGAQASSIDHLFAKREFKTTWGCDSCGSYFDLLVDGPDRVEVGINNERGVSVPCLHVLALRPRAHPVFAVISARDYGRKEKPFDGAEYFYNEHTCPTNWTSDIEMLIDDGDGDPHGVFEYVESVDLPPDMSPEDMDEFIHKSFPHLFEEADLQKSIASK
jgi:predicted RNA-binding Zn-ribbon protein involved in translation (DUF1610 family)